MRRGGVAANPRSRHWRSLLTEDPKKTSIHLIHHVTFAGVATRRSSLILALKSASDIRKPRIQTRAQTSAHRWHLEVRLEKAEDIARS
jgi:hypothetical protein